MATTHSHSTTLFWGKKAIFRIFSWFGGRRGEGKWAGLCEGGGVASAAQSRSPKRAGTRENGGNSLKFKPTPPKLAPCTPNRLFHQPKIRIFHHPNSARRASSFVFEVKIPKMRGIGFKWAGAGRAGGQCSVRGK